MRDVGTAVMFDMRAPAWGTPTSELYRAAIEMASFVDAIGVDRIGLMEHHGSDDGYLPQPFTLAAAMAAVTQDVRFLLGAVLLPLHDPVLVAEQIAITDLISNGRLNVIVGAGYVPFEYATFRKSLKDRAKLMDSGIEARRPVNIFTRQEDRSASTSVRTRNRAGPPSNATPSMSSASMRSGPSRRATRRRRRSQV